ncbi:ankyrin repeat and SOCS box protein 3-like isoform X2 [Dunckerocampus dactyliophorus]|uniref:ankyrin repeat and SOCS box protein 3-like isoform X2 n=1 Tax=Dunckerocampus dactyliophorus TaxID=161453 RepID=UPI00240492EA|nr:ankyrin repeat and SOCS box protein 3-like isoform X2 [Dunckerocampus dactyliophorus]
MLPEVHNTTQHNTHRARSFPPGMSKRLGEIMEAVKEEVKSYLPGIPDALLSMMLDEAGVECLEDLHTVEEKDLVKYLKPPECRKLLNGIKKGSLQATATRKGCRRLLRRRRRMLIGGGFIVDRPDRKGRTALHEAAEAGSVDCLKEILSFGAVTASSSSEFHAYVNSTTFKRESACYLAAQRGYLAAVHILLKAGANINQCTNDLACPLYAAVRSNHKDVVQLLVTKGAKVKATHTASCWTCLHVAVHNGSTGVLRMLAPVADLEARNDRRITALFLAAEVGQQECLEILVNAGANVNTKAATGCTPLLIASEEDHMECVDFLLDHGADPNKACIQAWPRLPIHAAAQFGHCDILRRLIPVTDRVCDRGMDLVSPLYLAVQSDKLEAVELLLREGFSPYGQDCTCLLGFNSPFSAALCSNFLLTGVLTLLLEAGVRLSEKEWTHVFTLHFEESLKEVLTCRWILPPQILSDEFGVMRRKGVTVLRLQELRDMLCVALNNIHSAAYWLPQLLKAGLEPTLLLQPCMLEEAHSDVLNYLLHFVNWSTLSASLKVILCRRQAETTWRPHPQLHPQSV